MAAFIAQALGDKQVAGRHRQQYAGIDPAGWQHTG